MNYAENFTLNSIYLAYLDILPISVINILLPSSSSAAVPESKRIRKNVARKFFRLMRSFFCDCSIFFFFFFFQDRGGKDDRLSPVSFIFEDYYYQIAEEHTK